MTAPGEPAAAARVWRQLAAAPDGSRAALERGLSPADLQTLLLDVSRHRARGVSPARLLRRWQLHGVRLPAAA